MNNFSRPNLTFDHPDLFLSIMILTRKKGERKKVDITPPELFANDYTVTGETYIINKIYQQLSKFHIIFK
jgi:hypothetical protein